MKIFHRVCCCVTKFRFRLVKYVVFCNLNNYKHTKTQHYGRKRISGGKRSGNGGRDG